jgi:hypothetical protein
MLNGQRLATFTCDVGQNCSGPFNEPVRGQPRLTTRGDTLRFVVARCVDAPETGPNECQGQGVIARIDVGYSRAVRP